MSRNLRQFDTTCLQRVNVTSAKQTLIMIPVHYLCNIAQSRFHASKAVSRWKLFWLYTTRFLPSTTISTEYATSNIPPHSPQYSDIVQQGSGPIFSAPSWCVAPMASPRKAIGAPSSDERTPSYAWPDIPISALMAWPNNSYYTTTRAARQMNCERKTTMWSQQRNDVNFGKTSLSA